MNLQPAPDQSRARFLEVRKIEGGQFAIIAVPLNERTYQPPKGKNGEARKPIRILAEAVLGGGSTVVGMIDGDKPVRFSGSMTVKS